MKDVGIFICGWLYVCFVEYCWHRWILHHGNHSVHNAHHTAFYSGEYQASRLLNNWALAAALVHGAIAWLLVGFMFAAVLALSLFTYLGVLEFLHDWIHDHPNAWISQRHIAHHRLPNRKFNIFLPVWDFIFRTA